MIEFSAFISRQLTVLRSRRAADVGWSQDAQANTAMIFAAGMIARRW